MKRCTICGIAKPLEAFHRHKRGGGGRHSWCRDCYNRYAREIRSKLVTREQRTRWNLSTRYNLTSEQVQAMLERQEHRCGICEKPLTAYKVDHCHETGAVRGLLCQRCNLRLSGVEDRTFKAAAERYLAASAQSMPLLVAFPAKT